MIVFESDYTPIKLKNFIDQLSPESFGINYDIGNSASMGFDPIEEIETYGQRILNVHIKDRLFNGATVPLGSGDAGCTCSFIRKDTEIFGEPMFH